MSQPPPPRPEDQPAQQPSQPHEPRTQSIPVITPDTHPEQQPAEPRPAFLSQPGPGPQQAPQQAGPQSPPTTAVLPAAVPTGAAQQVPGPPAPPQAAPAGPVWPAPGPAAGPAPGPAPAGPGPGGPGPDGGAPGRPHSTGPLDFVPGFSTPAQPPVPPAGSTAVTDPQSPAAVAPDAGTPGPGTRARAAGKAFGARLGNGLQSGRRTGPGPGRKVLAGLGLGVLTLVVLELGLTMDPGNRSLWSAVPSWSVFATVAAVVALVPLLLSFAPQRLPARTAWQVGAAGVAGLGAFWVLIVLPLVASDRGFLLTAALALAAGAVWLAPGREG